jgi:hypothetical protein
VKPWIVFMASSITLVKADTRQEAITKVLDECGYAKRPWVARPWIVRPATPAEVHDYANRVANSKRSRPLASQAKGNGTTAEDIVAQLL